MDLNGRVGMNKEMSFSDKGSALEKAVKRKYTLLYGVLALLLCLTSWACSWSHIEPFSSYSFCPLWLGYILFIDALVKLRQGQSLLSRSGWRFLQLFLASSLFWWIFEALNMPIQNWHYQSGASYAQNTLIRLLLASLDFSTVLPAVMETAEFFASYQPLRPRLPATRPGPRLPLILLVCVEIIGLACILLVWLFPRYCFVLVWLCLVFILDPVNNRLGCKSVLAHLAVRDWRFIVLPLAGLTCGFLWEMWNFYALPKWFYTLPYVGFWKIFEMPLLGYLGYLPFALELFAMYQFLLLLLGRRDDYLSF